jgi:hypothetical protein
VAYQKKLHRFADCGSNMGAGDRSDGHLTTDIRKVTCGACRARILNSIAQSDWEQLPSELRTELSNIAVKLDSEPG